MKMTKNRIDESATQEAYELLLAEEELILHAQMLIQRLLNEQGVSQKQLAKRMGVGDSYVSQMLGLSPRNLTLRTIARVMKALDVKATITLDEHAISPASANSVGAKGADAAEVVADAQSSLVWGEVVALPPRKSKSARAADADARAYASYDPPMHEIEVAMAA